MIKTVCSTSRIVSPAIWTSLVTRSMFAVSDLWPAFRAPFLVKSSCKISRERWLELAQLRIESWMWSELFAIYWAPMLVTRGTGPHPAMSTNTHQEAICPLTCSTNSDAGGGFIPPPPITATWFASYAFLLFCPLKFLSPAPGWSSHPRSCLAPLVQCSLVTLSRLPLVPLTLIKDCPVAVSPVSSHIAVMLSYNKWWWHLKCSEEFNSILLPPPIIPKRTLMD